MTYAESNSLSPNQVGGIIPATVENGEFVQDSELAEVGIKFQNDFLYASLSYYDQEKSFRVTKLTPSLQYIVMVLSWK